MTTGQPTIAVLDDEPQMRKALGRLLRTHGFTVETYPGGRELMDVICISPPDCLLLDLHMPGITGFEVIAELKELDSKVPIIVITGHDEPDNSRRVLALGAVGYLTKPIDEAVLLRAVRGVIASKPRGGAS